MANVIVYLLTLIFCLDSCFAAVTLRGKATLAGKASFLSSGSSAPFAPTDISGLQAWWKADSLSLNDGDSVTSWPTAGGPSRTATTGTAPVFKTNIQNGKPIVRFNGSAVLNFTTVSISAFSVFVVYNVTTHNDYQGPIFMRSASENGFQIVSASDLTQFYSHLVIWNGSSETANKEPTIGNSVTIPTGFMVEEWFSTPTLYRNATSVTIGNGGANWSVTGGGIGQGYTNLKGDIAEIIVYDSILGTTDRQSIETYLNTRWAVY